MTLAVVVAIAVLVVALLLVLRRRTSPPATEEERARRVREALGRADRKRRAAEIAHHQAGRRGPRRR